MNWRAQGFLILSKFFVGYGAGFSVAMPTVAVFSPENLTFFNVGIFPCISGLITVFPQLTKTFAEAGARR
jgi:hypothetical protein